MITGIVLGSLALLGMLALYQHVWIRVHWGPAGRSLEVRYLALHLHAPKRRRRAEAKGKPRARKKKKRARITITEASGWARLAPELLRAGGKGLRFSIYHSELHRLRVAGTVGTDDPATTGVLLGLIQAARGALGPWSPKFELDVTPDFAEGKTSLKIDAEGAVRLGALLATAVVILWHLPKWKLWRLLREHRCRKGSKMGSLRVTGPKVNLKKEVKKHDRAGCA